jgi:nickel/cobalt transporter (NicO) family protein
MRALRPGAERGLALAGLALALAVAALWAAGAFAPLASWAGQQQKAVQTALAGAVRALRGGQPGAWTALLAVCFSYGFFHAVGPGHGKAVIGSYGMARRVRLGPLAGLALASSLAQAAVAVLLVAGGAHVLGWTRERMEDVAETAMTPVSHGLVAGLGLWLLWRGARGLVRRGGGEGHDHHGHDHHGHDHHGHEQHGHGHHGHGSGCACGHAHGPSVEQVAQVATARDAALLVAAIALRPCSGALFLLILTFALGIGWAGVAGTFAMGLGTASVTVLVAGLAFWAREGAWAALPGSGAGGTVLARLLPVVELVAGAAIAAVALMLLAGSF